MLKIRYIVHPEDKALIQFSEDLKDFLELDVLIEDSVTTPFITQVADRLTISNSIVHLNKEEFATTSFR